MAQHSAKLRVKRNHEREGDASLTTLCFESESMWRGPTGVRFNLLVPVEEYEHLETGKEYHILIDVGREVREGD